MNQTGTPTILVSATGRQHGYGSDPYKWVSGLTAEERDAVRAGAVVLVTGSRQTRELPEGLRDVRRVKHHRYGGRHHYFPRVPREIPEDQLRAALGRDGAA